MSPRIALVLLCLAPACARERVFVCTSNEQCVDGDVQGFCQPAHVCSFPDSTCPSKQRYGVRAPDALSEACVAGDLVTALVARWGFDEGSGTLARDTSGYAVDARLDDSGEWVAGIWGSALRFNGSGMPVTAPGTSTRFGAGSFSGAAWVRSGATNTQARIFGRGFDLPGPGGYFFLNFGVGAPFTEFRDSLGGAWDVGADEGTITDEAWHHLAFALDRDLGRITFFVDGVWEADHTTDSDGVFGDATTQDEFLIGGQNGSAATNLTGDVDEIWIYARALTEEEMATLHQGPLLARPAP